MGFGYGLLVELGDVARKEGDIGKKRKGIGRVWWEMEWVQEVLECNMGQRKDNMGNGNGREKYGVNQYKQNELCPQAMMMNRKANLYTEGG